jgi:hypothetical protein
MPATLPNRPETKSIAVKNRIGTYVRYSVLLKSGTNDDATTVHDTKPIDEDAKRVIHQYPSTSAVAKWRDAGALVARCPEPMRQVAHARDQAARSNRPNFGLI